MLEAEEDAIGGACECEENEILVGSEGASRVDASYLPPFSDDIALLILARLPSSKYCDLRLVNRRFRSLIRSGELNAIRKKIGLKEPKIFFDSGEACCLCYEPYTRSCWDLPVCHEITQFHSSELFCVGTHLLVLRPNGSHILRYELKLNRWFKCPWMNTPRNFFASADCGSVACVAGGEEQVTKEVLNNAEKYNPESNSWESLPSMNMRRMFCSGFYMDSKFYVIGGRNENQESRTSGECYDFERNVWEVIPNMIEDYPSMIYHSLSLHRAAVVNNELYYLHVPSRRLKVYLKNNNTWKEVGRVPASIELLPGWRLALKSLGNELLLMGTLPKFSRGPDTILCFCTPSPELDDVEWHVLDFSRQGQYPCMFNYCIMIA